MLIFGYECMTGHIQVRDFDFGRGHNNLADTAAVIDGANGYGPYNETSGGIAGHGDGYANGYGDLGNNNGFGSDNGIGNGNGANRDYM